MKSAKTIVWVAFAVAAMLGVLLWTTAPKTPQEITLADIAAAAEKGGYKIMYVNELRERYERNPADLLLVDTRQEWEYRTGWIKGALPFPIEPTWWSRWRSRGALETLLGPDKNRLIVFY